jgi:hypothetical protein
MHCIAFYFVSLIDYCRTNVVLLHKHNSMGNGGNHPRILILCCRKELSFQGLLSKSKSHYDWRWVSRSVLVSSTLSNSWPDSFPFDGYCPVRWSALSDERSGLSSKRWSYITTYNQSVSQSWCQAPIRQLRVCNFVVPFLTWGRVWWLPHE